MRKLATLAGLLVSSGAMAQTATTDCHTFGYNTTCRSTYQPPVDPNPIGTALQQFNEQMSRDREIRALERENEQREEALRARQAEQAAYERRQEQEYAARLAQMAAKRAEDEKQRADIAALQPWADAVTLAWSDHRCEDAKAIALLADQVNWISATSTSCVIAGKAGPGTQRYEIASLKPVYEALIHEAMSYRIGNGRPKSVTQAIRYYRIAANEGSMIAQNSLGDMYVETGNKALAQRYFRMAAAQGYEAAAQRLAGR